MANAAGFDFDQDLIFLWFWNLLVDELKGTSR